jgi:hypothetical protein
VLNQKFNFLNEALPETTPTPPLNLKGGEGHHAVCKKNPIYSAKCESNVSGAQCVLIKIPNFSQNLQFKGVYFVKNLFSQKDSIGVFLCGESIAYQPE